jgi:hypothetical protein
MSDCVFVNRSPHRVAFSAGGAEARQDRVLLDHTRSPSLGYVRCPVLRIGVHDDELID